jgi:hypothetical protein
MNESVVTDLMSLLTQSSALAFATLIMNDTKKKKKGYPDINKSKHVGRYIFLKGFIDI